MKTLKENWHDLHILRYDRDFNKKVTKDVLDSLIYIEQNWDNFECILSILEKFQDDVNFFQKESDDS